MEKVTGKGFGFSWADEVEREEEEEEERQKENIIQIQEENKAQKTKKSTDPFGTETAREVILEENGVDWRKLDQEFDFNSNSTFRASNKGKEINRKNPLKLRNLKPNSSHQCNHPVKNEELVPPLKYPPKNINSVLEAIRKTRKDKSNENPNFMLYNPIGTSCSTMVYRPVPVPEPKMQQNEIQIVNPVEGILKSELNDLSKENSDPNISMDMQKKEVDPNWALMEFDDNLKNLVERKQISRSKKDKLNGKGNLLGAKSSNIRWVRKEKSGSNYERKALVDLNVIFEKPISKKTICSNNHFGVLDLLEQTERKLTCTKKSMKAKKSNK